ncbi:MAG: glutaredoxin family protein [Rhodocyclaceae bacterium]|nr:glutaredoxin family protein [Rhodocyclaceae bacterium]MCP5241267.1 glutaredoxin family protein [Zoogloeaceae bacterium]MCB1910575.1 glutaredoxin family protein [Rhodocyclaceae bacterium]MCP5255170.1 glutaredoxin family protein [Zoogloeaceae bacterium]MCP5294214.1 glutaredoxin family protein [Zoogloeaceae bacterium]
MRCHILLMLCCLSAGVAAQDATYHWKDERGISHYSDRPPPQSVEDPETRRFAAPSADKLPPYLVRKVAADFPVTVYVADTCGQPCEDGRALLSARGIPFSQVRVATPDEVTALRSRFNGSGIVPAILVGRAAFSGFSAERWTQLLDDAGYPKDQRGLSR